MARSERTRRAVLGALAIAASVAAPTRARADEAPEPIDVDYDAPMVCPGRAAFIAEVTARTSRARAASAGEKARVLHVRIERRGERHVGRLWIEDAGASSTTREVSGGTCGEVVGALGLIAALAVDPKASVAPRPAPAAAVAGTGAASAQPSSSGTASSPSAEPPTSEPPKSEPAKAEPAKTEPSKTERPKTESSKTEPTKAEPAKPDDAVRRDAPRSAEPRAAAPSSPAPFGVGAGIEISSMAGAVVGFRVFADAEFGRGLLSPAFRLAAARTLSADRDATVGTGTFTWTTGALDVCPIRVDLSSSFALRPCAMLSAGVLDAEASGVGAAQSRTRPWLATGAHARLVWGPIRALAVEIEGGASAPLYRESFIFEPSVTVYEAPVVAAVGRAGLSIRFP